MRLVDKCYLFFATSLINSLIQEHECSNLYMDNGMLLKLIEIFSGHL